MFEYIVVVITAIMGSIITSLSFRSGNALRSPYQPPSWVFSVVWTFIYVTYALIWARIIMPGWLSSLFLINMILNFLWVFVFFYLNNVFLSKIIIIALLILTLLQAYFLWRYSNDRYVVLGVFGLLIYAAWLTSASLLNFSVV